MSYRIIADSCCDKFERMSSWDNITYVPLTLELGDYRIFDDENFDAEDFVRRVDEYSGVPKTACPSPSAWAEAYDCEENDIYIVTITAKLSGTYNSALQGIELYKEEHPNTTKNFHVFDSFATSAMEIIIADEIKRQADTGKSFDEVVAAVDDFIANHSRLYFCLDSMDVLKSNGRMFAVAASILKMLKLKLIFTTADGNMSYITKELAMNRALIKMAGIIAEKLKGVDVSDKQLVITHVCCEDRAKLVADKLEANGIHFGNVEIIQCSGLNTTYASKGGLLVAYTF